MSKESFIYWLEDNTNLVPNSIMKYANAIDTISSELEGYGLNKINLYNCTDPAILDVILTIPKFQQKNKKGNNMYSSSINHFKKFIENREDKHFQSELKKDEIAYEESIRQKLSKEERKTFIVDLVKGKPDFRSVNNRKIWSRNPKYAVDTLVSADYLCEFDSHHNQFTSKFSQKNYVEAHHLVPMKFQEYFDSSLDNYANIVSLCVVCHKKLHYGIFQEKSVILDKLYQERKERLVKSGINITINGLYKLYNENE